MNLTYDEAQAMTDFLFYVLAMTTEKYQTSKEITTQVNYWFERFCEEENFSIIPNRY